MTGKNVENILDRLDEEEIEHLLSEYLGETKTEILARALETVDKYDLEEQVEYNEDSIVFSDGTIGIRIPVCESHRTKNGYLRPEVNGPPTVLEMKTGFESEEALDIANNGSRLKERFQRQATGYHGHRWGEKHDEKTQ